MACITGNETATTGGAYSTRESTRSTLERFAPRSTRAPGPVSSHQVGTVAWKQVGHSRVLA
jgi:hypothetical protein